ncbi:phospholipase A2-like [Ornithodoros turicata]|uniref:phospholipase A2-like n=1 Tax=Ornithodoros turicata TaxID=34597 RepID=UPI0031399625
MKRCTVWTLMNLLFLTNISYCIDRLIEERDGELSSSTEPPDRSATGNDSATHEIINALNKEKLHCNQLKKVFQKLSLKLYNILPKNWVSETARNNTQRYLDDCLKLESGMEPTSRRTLLAKMVLAGFVYPGTKWCGSGNRASNYDDLGEANTTDVCCRAHYMVNDTIKAFGKKNGIWNPKLHRMHSCVDDYNFYQCLLNDRSVTSEEYGQLYFDYLQPKCFVYAHPLKCEKWGSYNFMKFRWDCLKYALDTSKEKKWQTFPPPHFFQEYKWKWNATRPARDVGDTWKLVEFYDPDAIAGTDTTKHSRDIKKS